METTTPNARTRRTRCLSTSGLYAVVWFLLLAIRLIVYAGAIWYFFVNPASWLVLGWIIVFLAVGRFIGLAQRWIWRDFRNIYVARWSAQGTNGDTRDAAVPPSPFELFMPFESFTPAAGASNPPVAPSDPAVKAASPESAPEVAPATSVSDTATPPSAPLSSDPPIPPAAADTGDDGDTEASDDSSDEVSSEVASDEEVDAEDEVNTDEETTEEAAETVEEIEPDSASIVVMGPRKGFSFSGPTTNAKGVSTYTIAVDADVPVYMEVTIAD